MPQAHIRILLVEDNPGDAVLAREALRESQFSSASTPFQIEVVERLSAALDVLKKQHVDIVLLDLGLPDSQGFSTFQTVHAAAPDCAIVVLTGDDDPLLGARALREGAQDYLAKSHLLDGSLRRSIRYARDRKQAEADRMKLVRLEAARAEADAQRDLLRALFDGALDAMLIVDDTSRCIDVNAAATSLFGRSREALLASSIIELVASSGDASTSWREFLRVGKQRGEWMLQRPDGSQMVVEYHTAFIQSGRHLSVLRDVTERHSASRAKDDFLAMLGHELRNPLAPITTALQLMNLRSDSTKERVIIERQVAHLTRLVDDLLDISRITQGKIELQRQRIELATVMADALEIASPLLEQRRHHLHVEVPQRGLTVDGDRVRLTQVVSNLLNNAAKYTEREGRIEVIARRDVDAIVLRIRDSGIGISSEMLPKVFELFTQERQGIDRTRGGLGLGLAIVRTLVEMHGGRVAALSDGLGKGTEVVVRLPPAITTAEMPALAQLAMPQPSLQASRRVLLVDDNVDAALLLAESLTLVGHDVRVAHDGPSALKLVPQFTPDYAVLDIGLPAMDGYELARQLQQLPPLRHTRYIALTGYGQSSDHQRSADAGFYAHLVKPVQVPRLIQILSA